MIELVPGTRIYVYQNQLDKAMTRDSPTARARCIIMAFYTPEELVEAANLSGANEKRGLDPDVVDAVIGWYWFTYSIIPNLLSFVFRFRTLIGASTTKCGS